MIKKLSIAIAQLNSVVGDVEGNLAKARAARAHALAQGADLIIFPFYFISGQNCQDLASKRQFVEQCCLALEALQRDTTDGKTAIMLPAEIDGLDDDMPVMSGYLFAQGEDCEGEGTGFELHGIKIRFSYQWGEEDEKFHFIVDMDTDAYHHDQTATRMVAARERMTATAAACICVNPFGGHDGLVFEGGSFALQPDGEIAFQMPHFAESLFVSQWEKTDAGWWCRDGEKYELYQGAAADYHACMIGLRDYVNKNNFNSVLLGLSGGVDSALCAALAVDALGADRVQTVMLPYHYTSQESLRDAQECARRLGCAYQTIPIAAPVEAFLAVLKPAFGDAAADVTEENLQSRCRGVILMALSNKFGSLLLTTGNKSESAVGYATLYGDMCGGFNPIQDLYKEQVYALCHWRNNNLPNGGLGVKGEVIPQHILDRAPSAELRPDQKDEDSLPPYPLLDAILYGLIEENKTIATLVEQGFERVIVERVEDLLYKGEFKRQQSAPGVKLSSRSLSYDWHMPITHHFRDRI